MGAWQAVRGCPISPHLKQGYEKVILDSYYENANAIEFYKRNNFKPINITLEKKLWLA